MKTETHDEFVSEAVRTVKMGHADMDGYFDDLLNRVEIAAIAEHDQSKQILIKEQDKGFEITVENLSDIEVVGLLTIFKSRIELQLLQQFGKKGVSE